MENDFRITKDIPISTIHSRITGRVRAERQRLGFSQKDFAEKCEVPLRTYKRFEVGECDSLDVFLKVIKEFDRLTAIELLFPPRAASITQKDPVSSLSRVLQRLKESQ